MPRTINAEDRAAVAKNIRHTKLVDASRRLARIVKHVDPDAATQRARGRLEKDLGKWLRFHGGEAFDRPWSADHLKVLNKISMAVNNGGMFSLAMARGGGKTTILKWALLYVMLTGARKYVMVISATDESAKEFLEFVRMQTLESEGLYLHYPHVCEYVRKTEDKAMKARHQLWIHGERSGITWSVKKLIFPSVTNEGQKKPDGSLITAKEAKPYSSNGAILEVRGLTGAIRGKSKDYKSGKVLRPEFVILDDPQTRESAESPPQCAMRERIITGDVLGLAGPRKRIAAVMPCTIIRKGDLADRFLDHAQHPEWQGEVCRLVNKWPDAQDTLWKEYERIYREETGEGRGFGVATDYYKANRAAMDAGAEVSWEHRVRDGEISALQTAENLRIETGAQFWAEYQNDPQDLIEATYRLEAADIRTHQAPWPRFVVPDLATTLVAATDINRTHGGLHWVLVSFDQQMTAHVVVYGRWPESGEVWPKNAPVGVRQGLIFAELTRLAKHIAILPLTKQGVHVRPHRLMIDRGYEPEVVHRFCAQGGPPFPMIPCRGYSSLKSRARKDSLVGPVRENCHRSKSQFGDFVAFNADAVREQMQRAWMGDAGAPGCATLYQSDPLQHVSFSDHLCAEVLIKKDLTDLGMRYLWAHQPGAQWDWGDAMSMAYVGALEQGWTAQGVRVSAAPRRETRKCKVEAKRL
jgi:hypothetical protein